MTPRTLKNADIALAMELRTIGAQDKHIADGLGVHIKTLRSSIAYAEQHGYRKEAAPLRRRHIATWVNRAAQARIIASAGQSAANRRDTLKNHVGAQEA